MPARPRIQHVSLPRPSGSEAATRAFATKASASTHNTATTRHARPRSLTKRTPSGARDIETANWT